MQTNNVKLYENLLLKKLKVTLKQLIPDHESILGRSSQSLSKYTEFTYTYTLKIRQALKDKRSETFLDIDEDFTKVDIQDYYIKFKKSFLITYMAH